MTSKPTVAVIGDTRVPGESPQAALLREVGRVLVRQGCRIQTGGLGDLPRLVAEGARGEPGYQVGDLLALVPGFDPADGHADIVIPTGLDLARNALVANAEIVIAVGGGAGTLSEIALAWQMGRPIVAWTGGGWSARVANTALDHRRPETIEGFSTAAELAVRLPLLLGKGRPRHPGIRAARDHG